MGFWSDLWNGVVSFAKRMWNAIKRIVVAVVSLAAHVVNYFADLLKKNLLDQRTDKPFIGDYSKLKEAINNAPTRNVGIFRGVYNQETDEITLLENVEANSLDSQTKQTLGNDPLVLLT